MNENSIYDLLERAKALKKWESHDWIFSMAEIDLKFSNGSTMEFEIACTKCDAKTSNELEACTVPFRSSGWMLDSVDICLGEPRRLGEKNDDRKT